MDRVGHGSGSQSGTGDNGATAPVYHLATYPQAKAGLMVDPLQLGLGIAWDDINTILPIQYVL